MGRKPNLSNWIAAYRASLGLDAEQFAKAIGSSTSTIQHVENGRKISKSLKKKLRIVQSYFRMP